MTLRGARPGSGSPTPLAIRLTVQTGGRGGMSRIGTIVSSGGKSALACNRVLVILADADHLSIGVGGSWSGPD